MKKHLYQLITLIAIAITVISCGSGSSSSSSGPTSLGTVSNGSNIIISQSNFSITSSSGTTGIISITSESSPYVGTVTFSVSPTNGPTITTTPSPCVLNSATSSRGCTLSINYNNAANGTYTVTPTITDNSTGTAQVLSTFTITVSVPVPSPSPSPHVTPPPVSFTPTTQFGVYNNCPYTVWMQTTTAVSTPISEDNAPVKVDSNNGYSYSIDGQSVVSFRTVPTYGCDNNGNNCTTGILPGGPNSLFEGTFNSPGENGATTFDGSLVNGFTIPFSIQVAKASNENNASCTNAYANWLNLQTCPTEPILNTPLPRSVFGKYANGWGNYPDADLRNVNLSVINPTENNTVVGCAAPSTQLTNPISWGGLNIGANESSYGVSYYDKVIMYSCAFNTPQLFDPSLVKHYPPDQVGMSQLHGFCFANGYCVTPPPSGPTDPTTGPSGLGATKTCQAGPVIDTEYVKYIHENTSNIYSYAYDDVNGTLVCNSSQSKITFVLCPGTN